MTDPGTGGAEFALGTRRGIAACASARGTFAVLALDHRQNLRKELRPDDPASVTYDEMVEFKRAVVRALAPVATGTLLDPEIGAAQCIADGSLPATAGLLVAIEATGYLGPSTARVSRVLEGWSVEQAKRMGASAAKLLVYYHPEASNADAQERFVAEVSAACRAADLALFVEPLSFSLVEGEPLVGEARRRVVVETARRMTEIGGDILKAEFPYDPSVTDRARWREACAELDAALRRRRGCCCRAASTTRRSRRRSRPRATPVPAACSSAGRSGPMPRGWRPPTATRSWRPPAPPGSAGSSSWPMPPAVHGTTARTG